MKKTIALLLVLGGMLVHSVSARASVIITLEAFDQSGQPIAGPVAPGTSATVDLLLSTDASTGEVADVRLIQFDFDATSTGIVLDSFTWSVDANGYSFQDPDLPLTNVTSVLLSSSPDLLTLSSDPVKVASVDITINATGTLDALNAANTDDNFGADVRARFDMQHRFNSMLGNLAGGTLDFSVTGSGGGGGGTQEDLDGDGVIDPLDAFPDDPTETIDTDEDGSGNNADTDDDDDGVVDVDDPAPLDPDNAGGNDNDNNNANDNGNVNDNDNANENLNGNANDNDNSNDNIDDGGGTSAPRPRLCGAGMFGSSLLMLFGLRLMSCRSHRRNSDF